MAYNTIKLSQNSNIFMEKDAVAAITPGMLIELTSADKVQAHSGANGNALPMFACESELNGKGIDDAYVADDKVKALIPQRGDRVYALLEDGHNVAIGNFLVSNGDGYLQPFTGGSAATEDYPLEIVAMAIEAVDRSTSSGGDTNVTGRIVVMVV